MQVTFRCKRSGNTVSFANENDILSMRKHEGYDEVIDHGMQEKVQVQDAPAQEVKRRGRPKKVTVYG